MRNFRAGTFERDAMPSVLRRFSPAASIERVEDVDLVAVKESGKRLVLLDVDNTLLPWRGNEVPEGVTDWLERGKSLDLEFCILSNTRHPERLQALSEKMGVAFIRAKFKPSRQMYFMALEKYGAKPEETVMVGDQLLTDVLGANRSNIDAIWIKPIGRSEFVGTRLVSRNLERLIGRFLHNHFQPADDSMVSGTPGFFEHTVVRQFFKFCLVGGLSTVIDLGLHYVLLFTVPYGGTTLGHHVGEVFWNLTHAGVLPTDRDLLDAAYGPLKVPTVILAILNSYYWNRRWTFQIDRSVGHGTMIVKFFVVALVGMVLNVVVGASINSVLHFGAQARWAGASLIATVVVVFWNFFGQKIWTFQRSKE